MSRRAHAALWISCIVVALVAVPGALAMPDGALAFEARTESLLAMTDPRLAQAARECARAFGSRWPVGALHDVRPIAAVRGWPDAAEIATRWRTVWRVVVLRLALLACAWIGCLPVIAAGAIDGLAMRRARQGMTTGGSLLAAAAGGHLLIGLAFAPVLWAVLPLDAPVLALPAWALAVAATLSFNLSRAAIVNVHRAGKP